MKLSEFGRKIQTQCGRFILLTGLAAMVAFGVIGAASAGKPGGGSVSPSWKIVMLDDAHGSYLNSMPNAINVFGGIAGQVDEGAPFQNTQAAYWKLTNVNGTIQSTLSLLPGEGIVASGINDLGEIVGTGMNTGGQFAAFYWATSNAQPRELPPLPGDDSSSALAINVDGVVCGWSSYSGDGILRHAVAWRINWNGGNPIVWGPLELPGPADGSLAIAVNDFDSSGTAEIAGRFTAATGITAVVWDVQAAAGGTLSVTPAARVLDVGAFAYGINNSGVVCGEKGGDPVVWSGGSSTPLNVARYVYSTSANAINGNGLIVGAGEYHKTFEQGRRAVVWPGSRSSMILLDKFLPVGSPFSHLNDANAVDDLGRIIGSGWRGDVGYSAAFVAVPQ